LQETTATDTPRRRPSMRIPSRPRRDRAAGAALFVLLALTTVGELAAQELKFRRIRAGSGNQDNPLVPGKISVDGVDYAVDCPKKAGSAACVKDMAADLNKNEEFRKQYYAIPGYSEKNPGDETHDYIYINKDRDKDPKAVAKVNWKPGTDNPLRTASASFAPFSPYEVLYQLYLAAGDPAPGTATFSASLESYATGDVFASYSVDVVNGTHPDVVIGLLGMGLAAAGVPNTTVESRLRAIIRSDQELYISAFAIADVGTDEVPLAYEPHLVATAVPEPASGLLLVTGGAALALAAGRRRAWRRAWRRAPGR
jgi:hypothetical protein